MKRKKQIKKKIKLKTKKIAQNEKKLKIDER